MTYLVVMDGFENEGWKNILTLVAPSFYSEQIQVYYASQNDVSGLIDELMPLDEKHTFIFLTAQRGDIQENSDKKIEMYRLKKKVQNIKTKFPFIVGHQNVLLVVDDHKRDIANGEYREREKQIAYEMDKKGFLDHNDQFAYLFSQLDLQSLDQDFEKFKKTIYRTMSQSPNIDEIHQFEKLKNDICGKCQTIVEVKKNIIPDTHFKVISTDQLDRIYGNFCRQIGMLSLENVESKISTPSYIFAELLIKNCSLRDELNTFTVIEYPYRKEFNIQLFLNLVSLISVIHNSDHQNILMKYWFRIDNLEIDKERLGKALSYMEGIKSDIRQANEITVEIKDTENIPLMYEKVAIDYFTPIRVPMWYSLEAEEILEGLIRGSYQGLTRSIQQVKDNVVKIKKSIHNHTVVQKRTTLSINELQLKIKDKTNVPQISYHDSLTKIVDDTDGFELEAFVERALDELQKTPRFVTFWGLFFLFGFITLILYIAAIYKDFDVRNWQFYIFLILPVLIYLLVGIYYLVSLKKPLKALLQEYYIKISSLTDRLKSWQDSIINKYLDLFKLKLEQENRVTYKSAYEEYALMRDKKNYHNNKIRFLQGKAKELKSIFGLNIESVANEVEPDIGLSGEEIIEYSLFREKTLVDEIVIDKTKRVEDINAYGYISKLKFDKILDWKA